jgi:glycosyltransferase involved in cell wall biosynthesis
LRFAFGGVSNFSRSLLQREVRNLGDVRLVPNPIDRQALWVDRRFPPSRIRIGFVGGRRPRKGLDIFAEIALLLRHHDAEWHLWGIELPRDETAFVASCRGRLRTAGVESRFTWHGWLSEQAEGYRQLDLLIVPSRQESFGRVAAEGMASGLAVVASRTPGHEELIEPGKTGFLFEPASATQGAAYVEHLIRDPHLRALIGERAVRATARLDVAVVTDALLEIYDDLLHPATRARLEV